MDRADTAEKRNGDVSIELNSFRRLLKVRFCQNNFTSIDRQGNLNTKCREEQPSFAFTSYRNPKRTRLRCTAASAILSEALRYKRRLWMNSTSEKLSAINTEPIAYVNRC